MKTPFYAFLVQTAVQAVAINPSMVQTPATAAVEISDNIVWMLVFDYYC